MTIKNITEFRGAHGKEDTESAEFTRVLQDLLFPSSNKVLKLLAKEHSKQLHKSVKMCSKEKKTHGGEVVKDFAEQGAKTVLHQAGRRSKRRQDQRSNLSTINMVKLCSHLADPRRTRCITWRSKQ
jgi:hypothetical protein